MSNDLLILIILLLLFTIGAFFLSDRRKSRQGGITYLPQSAQYQAGDEDQLRGFPYRLKASLLSPAEHNFFLNLRGAVAERALITPKVGLNDIFWMQLEDKSQFRGYLNKIDRKHVDFLLCDPKTMRPLVGIELDDSSHQREDRQERDMFVDGVFAAAGLPLIHASAKRAYVVDEIAALLAPHLLKTKPAAPSTQPPQTVGLDPVNVSTNGSHPNCPKCGSEMILRTSKSGVTAGTKFWGCSNYPNCRGMVPYLN